MPLCLQDIFTGKVLVDVLHSFNGMNDICVKLFCKTCRIYLINKNVRMLAKSKFVQRLFNTL